VGHSGIKIRTWIVIIISDKLKTDIAVKIFQLSAGYRIMYKGPKVNSNAGVFCSVIPPVEQ